MPRGPPCRAPRPRRPGPAAELFRRRVHGSGRAWRAPGGARPTRAAGLTAAHAGASSAHGALPGPARAARDPLWFCSKSKPGSQLVLEPRSPARAWALLWAGDSPGSCPGDPSCSGRAGLQAGGGVAAGAGRPGPGRPGAVVRGVVLGEAPARSRVAVPGHNKRGSSPRWRWCRRLAGVLGEWDRGLGSCKTGTKAGRAGICPGTGWRGAAGTPAALSFSDQPFVCFVFGRCFGVFFFFSFLFFPKVTPGGCRLFEWRRPGGKSLAGGWGGKRR